MDICMHPSLKWSDRNQIVDQQPLRHTTKPALHRLCCWSLLSEVMDPTCVIHSHLQLSQTVQYVHKILCKGYV